MVLDLAVAFAAGLLSFASTCVLPLVPAYVAYMGGQAALNPQTPASGRQRRLITNAVLFVLGFSTAFVALGASAGLLGERLDLRQVRPALLQVAGIALVLIGISLLLLGRIPGLMRERRLDLAHRLPRTPWASYLIGLAFAIGWTPCVGPILAAILLRAGQAGTAAQGAVLLTAYSLGLGVPFLIAAGLSGMLTRLLARVRGAYRALNAVAAVFLIGMGVLIFSNRLTTFNSYLPFLGGTTPFDNHFDTSVAPIATVAGPLKPGQQAPAFTLRDVNGASISLAQLHGHPVLLSFWATWCQPCRQELPLIAQAYQAHQQDGLVVVAVDYGDESADTVRTFWTQMGLAPAPVLDPDGKAADAYGIGLKETGLPVSVMIARDGKVSTYEPYPLTPDTLDAALKKVL
ncbi:MAG TPA: cytochrome c biogenesis protein/redoxin [Candidatus Limnocylindrales bacterium]|nr:cytochrome c biogenesis protein/redoxin [Candidatus Limnocylindrales bacterium]